MRLQQNETAATPVEPSFRRQAPDKASQRGTDTASSDLRKKKDQIAESGCPKIWLRNDSFLILHPR